MSGARVRREGLIFETAHPCPEVELRVVAFAYDLGLSLRECATLLLVVGGGVNRKEAAHRLQCSAGTIDTYWRRILRKSARQSPGEVVAALLAFAVTDRHRRPVGADDDGGFQRYRVDVHHAIGSPPPFR
jgi:DNA-binding CsgD family transcriptional regulator